MQTTVAARDDFFLNVRTAVTLHLPVVDAGHPYTEKKDMESVLRRSDDWLSLESVQSYDERDFEELDLETRDALHQSIVKFMIVASKVGPKKPATPAQIDAALPPFLDIASIVRKLMLDDWLESARGLIDQAGGWAEAEGWPTKRYPWTLTERFLGTYELDRLIYGVMGSQMALIPVGRFVITTEGAFDLAVMPAYDSVMIVRGPNKKWSIRPVLGEKKSHRWSRSTFVDFSEKLSRMG